MSSDSGAINDTHSTDTRVTPSASSCGFGNGLNRSNTGNLIKLFINREIGQHKIYPCSTTSNRSLSELTSRRVPATIKEVKTLTSVCQNTDIKFDKVTILICGDRLFYLDLCVMLAGR
jgi:hypothetical protein